MAQKAQKNYKKKNKKVSLILALLLLISSPLICQESEESVVADTWMRESEELVLRVSAFEDIRPVSYINEEGEVSGISVEIFEEIARIEGWQIIWVRGSWPENLQRLREDEIDILTSAAKTEERLEFATYPDIHYINSWTELYVRRDAEIENMMDIQGKTVGLMLGDANGDRFRSFADDFDIDYEVRYYETYSELEDAMEEGEVDAGAFFNLFQHSHDDDIVSSSTVLAPQKSYFAINSSHPAAEEIASSIDRVLYEWKQDRDSVYYEIFEKYFERFEVTVMPEWIKWAIAALIVVLVLSVALIIILRQRNELRTKSRIETSRKQAEEAETKLQIVFDASPIAFGMVYAFEEDRWRDYISFANPAFTTITGYEVPDEGLAPYELFESFEIYKRVADDLLNQIREGENFSLERAHKLICKDGDVIYADISAAALDINDEEKGYIFTVTDVTDVRKTRIALKDSEERLRTTFENIGDAIIVFDTDLRVEMINDPATKVVHYPEDEAIGKHISEVFSKENFYKEEKTMTEFATQVLETGKSIMIERSVFHCNGQRTLCPKNRLHDIWITDSLSAIKDYSGNITGVVIVFRDITQEVETERRNKKLEEELNQTRKMEAIDQFSGGIAHDFNNIITAINGFAEVLLLNEQNKENEESLLEIKKSCQRASDLTDKLLTLSRKQIIHPQTLEINEVINAFTNVAKRITDEDIEIEAVLESTGYIRADMSQLDQIFLNVVANSRDAFSGSTQKNKKITFRTRDEIVNGDIVNVDLSKGDYVIIEIQDNGPGMSKDTIQKALEPFFTTKEKGKGTGLGLSTVYGIVRQNKGAIYIYSEETKGTTIKIYWPKAEKIDSEKKTIEKKEDTDQKIEPNGNSTILFVEDEESLRKLSSNYLQKMGYKVSTASNGEEALEILAAADKCPNLIITDMVMPQMGGFELAQEIKSRGFKCDILFMSGYSPETLESIGNYITKPYSLKTLVEKIEEVLSAK